MSRPTFLLVESAVMKRVLLGSMAAAALLVTFPDAQMRVVPVDELQGHAALGLALRHLANTGIVMEATAHPDDEDNGLLVMLNRGQGFRTALATATRGNGGQNEIGPEIFEALACFGRRSSPRCIDLTAPSSTSRARWISATRSASTRRSR